MLSALAHSLRGQQTAGRGVASASMLLRPAAKIGGQQGAGYGTYHLYGMMASTWRNNIQNTHKHCLDLKQ